MINITRKEDCCGCGACFDACSKNAIVWEPDHEGFSYPRVDTSKCVKCGLCNKVCPIENSDTINNRNKVNTPIVLGAYHKDNDIRFSSTSGGAFWGLAENFVKNGGYVAGAVFYDHFKIKHIVTNDLNELQKIKGSKYAQSDCRGIYRQIATLLKSGEKVMATGLPCQMAALRQYLRKDYDKLLVVDLICHSVTSQLPFQMYIDYLERKYNSKVVSFHPKYKGAGGWHKFAFKAQFANGATYMEHAGEDYYCMLSYGTSIMSRHSCFECHYKHCPQPSDITIGDFWGIEKIDENYDSPQGISKIVINTPLGQKYIDQLPVLSVKEFDAQISIYENPHSWSMIRPLKRCDMSLREEFVNSLHSRGFEYSIKKFLQRKPSLTHRILSKIKRYVTKSHK